MHRACLSVKISMPNSLMMAANEDEYDFMYGCQINNEHIIPMIPCCVGLSSGILDHHCDVYPNDDQYAPVILSDELTSSDECDYRTTKLKVEV